jgi:hypothetical protein
MRKNNRWRFGAVIAGVCALAVATPAFADVDTQYFATTGRASDPFIYDCNIPVSPFTRGKCMVTSQDLVQSPIGSFGSADYNPYPMSETRGFYSTDGRTWVQMSAPAVTEAKIGRSGFKHLWAPAVSFHDASTDYYYLYTPDLETSADTLTSRIYVTASTNPVAGFGDNPLPNAGGVKWREIIGPPTSGSEHDNLYMSDPEVFSDQPLSSKYTNHSNDYLLWADGDGSTCGSLSLRKMTSPYEVEPFTQRSQAYLTINDLMTGNGVDGGVGGAAPPANGQPGDQGLGTCEKKARGSGTIFRPYIEGGSLFRSDHWTFTAAGNQRPGPYVLMFAAKPSETPGVCKAGGQPNTANEVIAYATASTVTGPYTYKGIIMCGSSTEWTNQATLVEVKNAAGKNRLVLVYHDAPNVAASEGQQRKPHSECLFTYKGQFILTQRSAEGAMDVWGASRWCLVKDDIRAFKSVSNNMWVSNTASGLKASGVQIGNWEQFAMSSTGTSGQYYINSRNGEKYVTAATAGNVIKATSFTPENSAKFTFVLVSGSIYRIRDINGLYWQVQSDGSLKPGSSNPSSTDKTYQFERADLT